MTPANHPPSCRTCRGTGWQDGPISYETVNGQPHPYTSQIPCTHHWANDDPDETDAYRNPAHYPADPTLALDLESDRP